MTDAPVIASRPALSRLLGRLHGGSGQPAGRQLPWRRVLPVALLGLLAAALVVGSRVGLPDDLDPVAPFVVGYSWGTDQALAEQGVSISAGPSPYGYDGQWFLGQAHDPLLQTDVVTTFDAPRYRALRMLMPWAGWLLAAGQPPAIPYALLVVGILAVALGCAACARIGSGFGRSRWWGVLFAAIPGVVVGVAYGTAEPLGVALAALGLSLLLDRRYGWAGLAFAGAALTKETYLLFAVIAAGYLAVHYYLQSGAWLRRALTVAAPSAVLLGAWWWYVAWRLPPDTGPDPLRVFGVPLSGWWAVLERMLTRPEELPLGWRGAAIMAATFGLLVAGLVLAVRHRRSVLAYSAFLWGGYGLALSGLLLSRFLSTQRALAPAVLAAGLLVIAVGVRARPAPVPAAAPAPEPVPPAEPATPG